MIAHFHFLRPWLLLLLLPLFLIFWRLWLQKSPSLSWNEACDPHLLPYLLENKTKDARGLAIAMLFMAGILMNIALSGPAWKRIPQPLFQNNVARVVILDLSTNMLEKDLSPDRLTRAKFKLHDLFSQETGDSFGLVVYTGEAFVVSPLTEDGSTIDALLDMLTPDIMPVSGLRLGSALLEAAKLIEQAGFYQGELLVLTANVPDKEAVDQAKSLYDKGIRTSIMPMVADPSLLPLFEPLARAGHGNALAFSNKDSDLNQWIKNGSFNNRLMHESQNEIPLWRDEGRWFLIPALMALLPVFRRTWLQRI